MSGRLVQVCHMGDVWPFDMIREGVFVRKITFDRRRPGTWVVAPLCYVDVDVDADGGTVKAPRWGDPLDIDPDFPMTIVRDAPLPKCPPSIARAQEDD